MLATAKGLSGRFGPFLQNVFYMHLGNKKRIGPLFMDFNPPKSNICSTGSQMSELGFKCQNWGSERKSDFKLNSVILMPKKVNMRAKKRH